jgi:predicted RNase H-like HicB family nuclease
MLINVMISLTNLVNFCFFPHNFYKQGRIIDIKMAQKFTVIIEQGEDNYMISEVVELPGCHSQAKTYDELIERTKEAISLYLEVKGKPEIKSKFLSLQHIEIEA